MAKSVGCGVIGGAAVGLIFYGVTSWDAYRSTQREVGGIGGDWTQTVQENNNDAIKVVRLVLGFGSKLTALKIVGAIEYIKRFPWEWKRYWGVYSKNWVIYPSVKIPKVGIQTYIYI